MAHLCQRRQALCLPLGVPVGPKLGADFGLWGKRGGNERHRMSRPFSLHHLPHPSQACVLRPPLARDRCSTTYMHAPTSTSSPLQAAPCGVHALTHPRLLAVHLVPILYPCLHPVSHFRTGHGLRCTRPDFIYRLCGERATGWSAWEFGCQTRVPHGGVESWAHVTSRETSMSCILWGMDNACGIRRAEGLP